MSTENFKAHVVERLGRGPRPRGLDPADPRHWVAAGEVLIDILLAAVPPDTSDDLLASLNDDAAKGNPVGRWGLRLLDHWTLSQVAPGTTPLAYEVSDVDVRPLFVSMQALVAGLAAGADMSRVVAVQDALREESARGDGLAGLLSVMLDKAVTDVVRVTVARYERTHAEEAGSGRVDAAQASPGSPRADSSGVTAMTASKDGGGCYIATAVYGSYDAAPVVTLRRWRDDRLATSGVGRAFIRAYYALSPSLARHLGGGSVAARGVRVVLDALVRRLDAGV